jgi:micrococcal nuclease
MTTTPIAALARLALMALILLGAAACTADSQPNDQLDDNQATPASTASKAVEALDSQPATVARIVDGDTVWVAVDQGGGPLAAGATHKLRLLGYDAPEDTKTTQCGGPEATSALRRLIPVGSTVHLTADRRDTDRYGRFLRYVYTDDGTFVNREMVRRGHGHAVLYQPNDAHIAAMRRAERDAKRAERGVWGPSCASKDG